ncbi:helix-turn-helix domain-containing protein [Aestuariivivens sediminis]|uniref:helix-turn-helix domain-containing protein n=1 Tax=Aestuariivivens sediminis TaxID=2913557 RepID=UPI001F5671C8|nr:helix-turn-helix domain-containing protein [Aestuariivivens sediminis]
MSTFKFSLPDDLGDNISSKVIDSLKEELNSIASQPPKEILSIEETCEFLGLTKPTIHKYRNEGLLTAHYFGTKPYFKRSEILASLSPKK